MYFDDRFSRGGGEPHGPVCRGCKQPIESGQKMQRVKFESDPSGFKGMTGDYHAECSKLFSSLAHIVNMKPFG